MCLLWDLRSDIFGDQRCYFPSKWNQKKQFPFNSHEIKQRKKEINSIISHDLKSHVNARIIIIIGMLLQFHQNTIKVKPSHQHKNPFQYFASIKISLFYSSDSESDSNIQFPLPSARIYYTSNIKLNFSLLMCEKFVVFKSVEVLISLLIQLIFFPSWHRDLPQKLLLWLYVMIFTDFDCNRCPSHSKKIQQIFNTQQKESISTLFTFNKSSLSPERIINPFTRKTKNI